MKIYVAGPYSPTKSLDKHEGIREAAQNTEHAIEAGIAILNKGHIPYIPHLSHFVHTHHACNHEYKWYVIDNSFIEDWAEALLYLAPSFGADAELKLAAKLGLKIFYSLNEIPDCKLNKLIER